MNSAPARWSTWLTRAWLSLLLLVPCVAGCDASGGSGNVHWTAQARVVTPSTSGPASSTPPVVLRVVQNQAVPPGPRRPAVAAKQARAGKPNPKLREAVVRATRQARAETLAAKDPAARPAGKTGARPLADARPWRPETPPAAPHPAASSPPAAPAAPQPIVTAGAPAPAPAHDHGDAEHRAGHDPSEVASPPEPGPLEGLDWNVPVALLVGALAAALVGARRS